MSVRFSRFSVLLAAISVVLAHSAIHAKEPAPAAAKLAKPAAKKDSYIRVSKDAKGNPLAMETSIVRFVPKDGTGPTVDLISAVHVGEKSYYEALNKKFTEYDALLYELVAPEGTRVPKGGGKPDRNALSSVQNAMKDILELEYQLVGIDYTKDNFIHADMSPDEFAKSMKDKGESFWSMFFRLMAAGMAQQANNAGKSQDLELLMALFDQNRALKLKRVMADQFQDMDIMMAALNGPDGSTIITERNKAALKVLKRELDGGKKKVAIFYGGGHMDDMEQRLVSEFNLKRDSVQWLEAWNLRDK